MKFEIEEELQGLLGLPLRDLGRSSDLVWFIFGNLRIVKGRNGKEKRVGDYALHVQCSWRLTKDSSILIAHRDIYVPSDDVNVEKFEWDVPGNNRFDQRVNEVFAENLSSILVNNVVADNIGGVQISFTDSFAIDIFPDQSTNDEFWRLLRPEDASSYHFVVTGKGIEKE
jgi:hypothetical protein